jgi:hypothetical protein
MALPYPAPSQPVHLAVTMPIGSVIRLLSLDLAVPDHTTLSRRAGTLEVPRTGSRSDGQVLVKFRKEHLKRGDHVRSAFGILGFLALISGAEAGAGVHAAFQGWIMDLL